MGVVDAVKSATGGAPAGISLDHATTGCAVASPSDHLTPDGQMPQGNLMSKGVEC